MRDVADRAERHRQREERPLSVVALSRLGGGTVLCPAAAVVDADDEDEYHIRGDQWLAGAAVDLTEVA